MTSKNETRERNAHSLLAYRQQIKIRYFLDAYSKEVKQMEDNIPTYTLSAEDTFKYANLFKFLKPGMFVHTREEGIFVIGLNGAMYSLSSTNSKVNIFDLYYPYNLKVKVGYWGGMTDCVHSSPYDTSCCSIEDHKDTRDIMGISLKPFTDFVWTRGDWDECLGQIQRDLAKAKTEAEDGRPILSVSQAEIYFDCHIVPNEDKTQK